MILLYQLNEMARNLARQCWCSLDEWVSGWMGKWVSGKWGWGVWGRTEWVQCVAARRLLRDMPHIQLFWLFLCRPTLVRGDQTHITPWMNSLSLNLITIVMVMFVFMLLFPAEASSSWLRLTANNRLYTIDELHKRLNQKRMFGNGESVCSLSRQQFWHNKKAVEKLMNVRKRRQSVINKFNITSGVINRIATETNLSCSNYINFIKFHFHISHRKFFLIAVFPIFLFLTRELIEFSSFFCILFFRIIIDCNLIKKYEK